MHLVELMTACSGGQEEALAELYDLTSSRIYGMVLWIVRSTELAAEVTREVYVDVWRQSARYFPGNGSVLRWVMGMAHRRSVDRVRLATI
ncbi:MAG: sigma factor [Propionicimonas sp.]